MDKVARRRLAVTAATICAIFAGGMVAPGAEATPPQATGGKDRLRDLMPGHDRTTHGRPALDALADRLPEAARRNGLAAEKLREVLAEDPSAWLDADARLFYEEPARTEGAAQAPIAEAASIMARASRSVPCAKARGSASLISRIPSTAIPSAIGWKPGAQ